MLKGMQRIARISSIAMHGRHGLDDCAAMTPNERVAHLVRMCDRAFADQTSGLRRVARIRRLKGHTPRTASQARG